MWTNPTVPNVTDYTSFLRDAVGIGPQFLPDASDWIPITLSLAVSQVNETLQTAGTTANASTGLITLSLYVIACYNFAADRLINFAQDVAGQTFFKDTQRDFGLTKPAVGVVSSAADQGTSGSLNTPEFIQRLTLQDLSMMKTPYGRAYMELALAYGPALWGLS